jgi:hypothetical protein
MFRVKRILVLLFVFLFVAFSIVGTALMLGNAQMMIMMVITNRVGVVQKLIVMIVIVI